MRIAKDAGTTLFAVGDPGYAFARWSPDMCTLYDCALSPWRRTNITAIFRKQQLAKTIATRSDSHP
jgi:hypothetical protein